MAGFRACERARDRQAPPGPRPFKRVVQPKDGPFDLLSHQHSDSRDANGGSRLGTGPALRHSSESCANPRVERAECKKDHSHVQAHSPRSPSSPVTPSRRRGRARKLRVQREAEGSLRHRSRRCYGGSLIAGLHLTERIEKAGDEGSQLLLTALGIGLGVGFDFFGRYDTLGVQQ